MENIELLKNFSSHLYGKEKEDYLRKINLYISLKGNIEHIKKGEDSSDVTESLSLIHKEILDSSLDPTIRKEALVRSLLLYKNLFESGKNKEIKKKLEQYLEEKLINGIYPKILYLLKYDESSYNEVIGLIRTYYDLTLNQINNNLSVSFLENEDFWVYENIEKNFLNNIEKFSKDKIFSILDSCIDINYSYISVLFLSSHIISELLNLNSRLEKLEEEIDSSDLIGDKINKILLLLKKGNATIAYENSKQQELKKIKKGVNELNVLFLNFDRR